MTRPSTLTETTFWNVRAFTAVAALGLFAVALTFAATRPVDVSTDKKGLALSGYDPVAYFTEEKPVKGTDELTATHGGATAARSPPRPLRGSRVGAGRPDRRRQRPGSAPV